MVTSWGAVILLVASSTLGVAPSQGDECTRVPGKSFRIVLESKMNQSGVWETTFNGQQDHLKNSDAMKLDLNHSIVECDGRQVLRFSGVFKDSSKGSLSSALRFHSRCGTNIAITNHGQTVLKLSPEDRINSVVLTNRPLGENEIFKVRLDKKLTKDGYFMGIGLTTMSPHQDPIPSHLNSLKSGTWMFYHSHAFHNGTMKVKTYARNLDQTQAGDIIGIARSDTGTLHLYHNGIDQGPAASNLPPGLYGGLELYGDISQMTIIS